MKSFLRKIPPFLFAIWTFGIMTAYFYFYQNYGQFYLDAFVLILLLAAFFVPILFFASLPLLLQGKPSPVLSWLQHLPPTFFVPIKSLVVVFYGCIASWILLIYLLKPDIGISLNSALSVSLVTLITLAGFSIGSRLIRRFHIETDGPLERFVLSTLLGFGMLMFVVYIAGMVGLLYRIPAYTLVFGALFLFRREWLSLFSDIKKTALPWKLKPFFTFDNFAITASALLSVFAMTGLLSQFAAGWDEMHTYQAFPHAYAEAHRIVNFPYWHAGGYPQNTEMLFTLGFLLHGFTVSAGLNVIFYFLVPIILILIKQLILPQSSSKVVFLLFFISAIPFVMINNDHKVEPAFWSYALLSIFYLLKFFHSHSNKALLIADILMGITAGIKYTFLSIIFPSLLIAILLFPLELNIKKRLANAAICFLILAASFSPWAIKNIVFSRNPIEPALGDTLSQNTFLKQIGRSYSDHLHEHFMDVDVLLGDQEIKNWEYYVLFPFQFTFKYRHPFFEDIANIGPIYLIFLPLIPLGFFSRESAFQKTSLLTITASLTFIQTAFWFFFAKQISWYNMVAMFLMFPFIALLLKERLFAKFRVPLIASVVALALSTVIFRFGNIFRSGTFFMQADNGNYTNYEVAKFFNENARPGVIWDTEGFSLNYYVNHSWLRVIYDQHLQVFHFLHKKYPNDQDFIKYLHSMNVSYFVLNIDSFSGWLSSAENVRNTSPKASLLFQESFNDYLEFRDKYLTEVFHSGNSFVYTFREDL